MIDGYADLIVTAGAYSGRNDAVAMMPTFLGLAEAKMNRVLRLGAQETTATLTLVNGDVSLPSDFLELRDVRLSGRGYLRSLPLALLNGIDAGGEPAGFAVVGNILSVRPTLDGPLSIVYYAALPPLSPAQPTNWLLQVEPNAYLYALVEEIAIWGGDIDRAGAAKSQKDAALAGLPAQDDRSRYNMGRVVIGGPTP